MARTLDKVDRRLSRIDEALIVPDPDLIPRDEAEFNFLLSLNGIEDEQERDRLRGLWLAGLVLLFFSWSNELASIDGAVAYDVLEQQMRQATARNAEYHRRLAQQLMNGDITIDEFESLMSESIRDAAAAMALAVFGPRWMEYSYAQAAYADYLARELGWLAQFVSGLRSGTILMDGNVIRRAAMYGFSAYVLFEALQGLWASQQGYTHEENVLGWAEHCNGCLVETGKGIVPIGSLAPIGTRDCLSNCRCRILYYRLNPLTGEYEQ